LNVIDPNFIQKIPGRTVYIFFEIKPFVKTIIFKIAILFFIKSFLIVIAFLSGTALLSTLGMRKIQKDLKPFSFSEFWVFEILMLHTNYFPEKLSL
jgi:hypothetical protein